MKSKFYQASSSEMYGKVQAVPQRESTPFYPRSPYGAAKVYAYRTTVNYRERYGLFACNGILFNHESPRRGQTFVTRKVTAHRRADQSRLEDKVYLGNLEAKRDWDMPRNTLRGHVADASTRGARRRKWIYSLAVHPRPTESSVGERRQRSRSGAAYGRC